MRPRLLVAFLAVLGGPCLAQSTGSPPPATAAFDSFLRISAFNDKPVSELSRIWPSFSSRMPEGLTLALTAAHRIAVSLDTTGPQSDTNSARVLRTTYMELLPDTLSLRRRTLELMQRIAADHGAAVACELPLGPPAFLFAPQRVARFWTSGIAKLPTQLRWEVSAGPIYAITIDVGRRIQAERGSLACDSRMP